MLSASLRTGTTMETEGWDVDKGGSWLEWGAPGTAAPDRQPLLWGGCPAGNPFEAPRDRSRKRHDGAVGTDGKREPARREPVAHRHGAHHAQQGAGGDV